MGRGSLSLLVCRAASHPVVPGQVVGAGGRGGRQQVRRTQEEGPDLGKLEVHPARGGPAGDGADGGPGQRRDLRRGGVEGHGGRAHPRRPEEARQGPEEREDPGAVPGKPGSPQGKVWGGRPRVARASPDPVQRGRRGQLGQEGRAARGALVPPRQVRPLGGLGRPEALDAPREEAQGGGQALAGPGQAA